LHAAGEDCFALFVWRVGQGIKPLEK
jgi:hypothetical protein